MKKPANKLTLRSETIRALRLPQLRDVDGGFPTETRIASGCGVTDGCGGVTRGCDGPGTRP